VSTLRNIGFIVQKEWRHYFASPIAYAALTFWAFLVGFFYFVNLAEFLQRSAMMAMRGGGYRPSLNDWVIGGTIYSMAVISLFIMPMLTMRLLAEEKRQGTIELLATSPITDLELVLGKFFGALALYGVMIAVGFLSFGFIWWYADAGAAPDWRPLLTGALALVLVGGAFIAVGLFISSLTRNQIVAGTATFAVLLVFWLLSAFEDIGGPFTQFLSYLGLISHIRDLIRGVIDLKDVVYYLSFIIFGLFLAQQSMESQRWRA
jgi:ABC-2 type transport system permease protein